MYGVWSYFKHTLRPLTYVISGSWSSSTGNIDHLAYSQGVPIHFFTVWGSLYLESKVQTLLKADICENVPADRKKVLAPSLSKYLPMCHVRNTIVHSSPLIPIWISMGMYPLYLPNFTQDFFLAWSDILSSLNRLNRLHEWASFATYIVLLKCAASGDSSKRNLRSSSPLSSDLT